MPTCAVLIVDNYYRRQHARDTAQARSDASFSAAQARYENMTPDDGEPDVPECPDCGATLVEYDDTDEHGIDVGWRCPKCGVCQFCGSRCMGIDDACEDCGGVVVSEPWVGDGVNHWSES